MAFAGVATAAVVVTGDNNGTFTAGQAFVISVGDSWNGPLPTIPGSQPLYSDSCNSHSSAQGYFQVGPLDSVSQGDLGIPLNVSCSSNTWSYSGDVTLTIHQTSTALVNVVVYETVPATGPYCNSPCGSWETTYNFNQTYPVASTPTTTSQTSTTTTAPAATTTSPAQTSTSAQTTSATTTGGGQTTPTVTITTPTTVTVTTGQPGPPPPASYVINVPSTITIQQSGPFIYITITSNDQRTLQTLCWHRPTTAVQTCAGSHGVWRIKLRRTPGKRIFILRSHGKVVARKTVSIRIKP